MPPKDVERMANSVDPDQTALKSSLIRIYIVCSDIHVPIFRIFTVTTNQNHDNSSETFLKSCPLYKLYNSTILLALIC